MKNYYVNRKVFDIPSGNVKTAFFECFEGQGNDCYVSWTVNGYDSKNTQIVDKWLLENGAIKSEEVLINHSW